MDSLCSCQGPEDNLGRQIFLDEVHDPEEASASHIPSLPSLTGAPGVFPYKQTSLYDSRFQVMSILTRCVWWGAGGECAMGVISLRHLKSTTGPLDLVMQLPVDV